MVKVVNIREITLRYKSNLKSVIGDIKEIESYDSIKDVSKSDLEEEYFTPEALDYYRFFEFTVMYDDNEIRKFEIHVHKNRGIVFQFDQIIITDKHKFLDKDFEQRIETFFERYAPQL